MSKCFYNATCYYLWREIVLPPTAIPGPAPINPEDYSNVEAAETRRYVTNQARYPERLFHHEFEEQLGRYTRSFRLDLQRTAPGIVSTLRACDTSWESRVKPNDAH